MRNIALIRRSVGDLSGAISLTQEAMTLYKAHYDRFFNSRKVIPSLKGHWPRHAGCGWYAEAS